MGRYGGRRSLRRYVYCRHVRVRSRPTCGWISSNCRMSCAARRSTRARPGGYSRRPGDPGSSGPPGGRPPQRLRARLGRASVPRGLARGLAGGVTASCGMSVASLAWGGRHRAVARARRKPPRGPRVAPPRRGDPMAAASSVPPSVRCPCMVPSPVRASMCEPTSWRPSTSPPPPSVSPPWTRRWR